MIETKEERQVNTRKKVLLIGGNFSPELTGIGKYNGEMIHWLAEKGHDCTVITTFPYYPDWKVQEPFKRSAFWFKKETKIAASHSYKIIRCPHYIPKKPSGLKRLIADCSIFFSTSIALLPLLFSKKYDFVITVAPPFTLGILGSIYKYVKGAKFLYHIQDLQIDAARDLKMITSRRVISLLLSIENFILKRADVISTISKGMMQKVREKCNREIVYFPNWVEIDGFYPINNKNVLKEAYGFSPNEKVVLYSGAIGEKQGLEAIIESAKYFISNSQIKFVICGSGPYKQHLIQLQQKFGLDNVSFLPLQPAEAFNQFLNMADVHLVLQKATAADLVLPSKLSAILATGGISIVAAGQSTSLYEIMQSSDMGFVIEPENQTVLNDAIARAAMDNHPQKRKNAREYAEKFLSIDSILSTFSKEVLDCTEEVSSSTRARKALGEKVDLGIS